jgi:hypothetical protein
MIEATSPRDRAFYLAMALVLVALAAAGFAPTFYARSSLSGLPPLPLAVALHGVAGTAWVALFAIQAGLIASRRVLWHRRLGALGAVLAIAFVASGIAVIAGLERSHAGESRATFAAHLFTNGAPLTAFALFVAAAVWQRGVAASHKRLMLLAAIVLTPPAIGRLFAYLDVTQLNLLAYASLALANAVYDTASRGRPHAVSLLGATALVAIDVTTTQWLAAVGS